MTTFCKISERSKNLVVKGECVISVGKQGFAFSTPGRWRPIFILNFSLVFRSSQLGGAHANEIKHNHSPVVYVVLDPSYDYSYKTFA